MRCFPRVQASASVRCRHSLKIAVTGNSQGIPTRKETNSARCPAWHQTCCPKAGSLALATALSAVPLRQSALSANPLRSPKHAVWRTEVNQRGWFLCAIHMRCRSIAGIAAPLLLFMWCQEPNWFCFEGTWLARSALSSRLIPSTSSEKTKCTFTWNSGQNLWRNFKQQLGMRFIMTPVPNRD